MGMGTCFFCVAPDAQTTLSTYWKAEADIEMECHKGVWAESCPFQGDMLRSFWNKKEAIATPKAFLSVTRMIYEHPHYKEPSDF